MVDLGKNIEFHHHLIKSAVVQGDQECQSRCTRRQAKKAAAAVQLLKGAHCTFRGLFEAAAEDEDEDEDSDVFECI